MNLGRGLAWVLLIGITYAATFGYIHNHGYVSPRLHPDAASTVSATTSVSSQSPINERTRHSECLICLLQFQLFNGAVAKLTATPSPQLHRFGFALSTVQPYFSVVHTPQRGRAPPLSSIS